jgi:hypothetical protein
MIIYTKTAEMTGILNSDTIVVCIGRNGCVVEGYYAHLDNGDKYMLRSEVLDALKVEVSVKKERNKSDILDFIINSEISWDVIGHPSEGDAEISFWDDGANLMIAKYPYENQDSVLEGIEFIMDMNELFGD